MTELHNASLAAGASSAAITVEALQPHGVNCDVETRVASRNATTGKLHTLARIEAGAAMVVYPTTNSLVLTNLGTASGNIQLTAR